MITISFDAFSAKFSDLGKAVKQNDSIFFIKAGKAGKVELNKKSQTFTVGSGSGSNLSRVTEAAYMAGFKLVKFNKGWAIFKADDVEDFQKIFGAVTSAVVGSEKSKAPKTVKIATIVKAVGKAYVEKKEAEAIKAKNLETMKAVTAKRAAALVG